MELSVRSQPEPRPDRAALVTGASRGIGFALAELLVEQGYAVTLVSRSRESIEAAAKRLSARGGEVVALAADLTVPAAAGEVTQAHRSHFGRLDVLVNNAGFGIGGELAGVTDSHLDLQYEINLRAPILVTRESLPLLKAAGAEHGNALIINLSSVSGKIGTEWLSIYSAMKHGIVGFSQALNRELHTDGIKACALCPGYVNTDLSDFIKDEIAAEEMIQTSDIKAMVAGLLQLSRWCVVPELIFTRPGDPTVN